MPPTVQAKPVSYHFIGPVRMDFATRISQHDRAKAESTKNTVLDVPGFRRGGMIPFEHVFSEQHIGLSQLITNLGGMTSLTPNLGGPAALATLAAFNLGSGQTSIGLHSVTGSDDIGKRIIAKLAELNMDWCKLTQIDGETPKTLEIREEIPTIRDEKRVVSSFVHLPGFTASKMPKEVSGRLEASVSLSGSAKNVMMFSDIHLMPGISTLMMKILAKVRADQNIDAVMMLDVNDGLTPKWLEESGAKELFDFFVMNRRQACRLANIKEDQYYPSKVAKILREAGYKNGFISDGSSGASFFNEQGECFLAEIPAELSLSNTPKLVRHIGGIGGYFAGAAAVTVGENMPGGSAASFVTTAATKRVLGQMKEPATFGWYRNSLDASLEKAEHQSSPCCKKMTAYGPGSETFSSYAADTDN